MVKSNNNQIMFSVLLLLISLISISSVSAIESSYLKVIAEEVTPEPVEPGQDVTVKIRLINEGVETAEEVSIKLNNDYPFFVKTESSNFKDEVSLCGGCSVDNTYYLTVAADAKSGLYPLDFEIYRGDIVFKPSDTIDINVIGKPDIVLGTEAIDSEISSGEKFTIHFDAKNIGTGIARNIKISPQSEDILMLGSNINLIEDIEPEGTISFSLEFIVKDSLIPDTYKFPINIEYVDEQGTSYEDTFNIGVDVLNRAEIGFQSIKIIPTNPTLADDVRMEGIIENIGTGDADQVTVELITSDGKTYKAFVGQLQADDDSPFYFDAKPESVGVQTATLKISYYDDFGFHTYETTLEKEVGRPTNNLITAIIILLLVGAGAGYFYYKKKHTEKKK